MRTILLATAMLLLFAVPVLATGTVPQGAFVYHDIDASNSYSAGDTLLGFWVCRNPTRAGGCAEVAPMSSAGALFWLVAGTPSMYAALAPPGWTCKATIGPPAGRGNAYMPCVQTGGVAW